MNIVRFYRAIYRDNAYRTERKRKFCQDLYLYGRNRALQPLERLLVRRHASGSLPLIFIVGAPRSGTTLIYQLLVRHLELSYVSNYAARYWMAPVVGTILQRARCGVGATGEPLSSTLGSTVGELAPHEFSYFWQFWTDFGDTDQLTERELTAINWRPIEREMLALAGYEGKPYLAKAVTFANYHIEHFSRVFPTSRFIYIDREPTYVAQSILEARKLRYGSEQRWWSIRPRDLSDWKHRPPVEQVCHQLVHCNKAIVSGLQRVDASRSVRLSYEALCERPAELLTELAEFCATPLRPESGLDQLSLRCGNVRRLDQAVLRQIAEQLAASG